MSKKPAISVKQYAMLIGFLVPICTIAMILAWRTSCSGQPKDIPLDISIFEDSNIFRLEDNLKKYNSVKMVITQIDKFADDSKRPCIKGYLLGNKKVIIHAYVTVTDVKKLDIGDIVAVTGDLSYDVPDYIDKKEGRIGTLSVGDSISMWPFTFKARLAYDQPYLDLE